MGQAKVGLLPTVNNSANKSMALMLDQMIDADEEDRVFNERQRSDNNITLSSRNSPQQQREKKLSSIAFKRVSSNNINFSDN